LLIVEDDRATSMALRAIFARLGWRVDLATSLSEALPLLESQPECVILDLMLPDGDGITLLQTIRASSLPMRVAVTTGTSDPQRLKAVTELRPEVLLQKPIRLDDLLTAFGLKS
jgi:DNA-binding response OmpR family regulator